MTFEIQKLNERESDTIKKILVYALPGTGKTTLVSQMFEGKRVLIIDTEQGTRFIPKQDNIDVLHLQTFPKTQELRELQDQLKEYDVVIVDSIMQLQEMFLNSSILGPNHKKSDGTISLQGYGFLKARVGAIMEMLYRSVEVVCVVAHQTEKSQAREAGESTTSIIAPSIMGGLYDVIVARMEMILKLQVFLQGDKEKRVVRIMDKGSVFVAKDRPNFFGGKKEMEVAEFIKEFNNYHSNT